MRQAAGETLKNYLARFTDEIIYCEQIADKEALLALNGGLNMSNLFWRDVRNKNPVTYNELVEMMRVEIVNEEMIDHRNGTMKGLWPPQRPIGRGSNAHLVSQQWTQAGHAVGLTSGQALASATLNAVLILEFENVGPSTNIEAWTSRRTAPKSQEMGRRFRHRPVEDV